MASSFFSIPGNIKQMYLPFVLNPYAGINMKLDIDSSNIIGRPQFFSFRSNSNDEHSYAGKINICPSSFANEMSFDISHQLLYENQNSKNSININTIFDAIPGIQIREFLPDTRLDQALDFMGEAMSKVTSFFKHDKKTYDEKQKKQKKTNSEDDDGMFSFLNNGDIITKITRTCKFALKYLTGFTNPNLYTDSFKNVQRNSLLATYDDNNLDMYIHTFPYTFWYQLQSCTTTNIYELPCITSDKLMYSSDGNQGWPSAGLSLDLLGNAGGKIGSIVKSLLGNINISFMPWWDAKSGNATPHPDVVVKFDLFNDSAIAALTNFIFVNTIVPNAKWLQYNIFQHSPNLYDVKVEGYGRLFACSASFKVTYGGVLREMPDIWIDEHLSKHINQYLDKSSFVESIKRDKLIKIPDIYHVEMTFKSLLPDNFNNYLYTYSQNATIVTEYLNHPEGVYQKGKALDIIGSGINNLTNHIKDAWYGTGIDNNGNFT